MNKHLSFLYATLLLLVGSSISAVTIGMNEPPAKYINNLQSCTPTVAKTGTSFLQTYKIIEKLPDGRCHITITGQYDYNNPQVYKDALWMLEAFNLSKEEAQKTLAEEIKNQKKEITECKFTQAQTKALYNAYLKHDGNNTPADIKRDNEGNIVEFKSTFNSSNLSSYDSLMINYSNGTCKSIDN